VNQNKKPENQARIMVSARGRHVFEVWLSILYLALSAPGCDPHGHTHKGESSPSHEGHDRHDEGNAHEEGSEHEHGGEAVVLTKYTDELELFAEYAPPVTGQELSFLAHLTILENFAPLRKGTVTFVLEGNHRVEVSSKEMLRPGIALLKMQAPAPGKYQGSIRVTGPEVEDEVRGFEVVVYPDQAAARKSSSAEAGGETIPFLKEQQWDLPFSIELAESGAVAPTTEVSGEVTTPPSGQAEIGAAIAGRIVAPNVGLPRPGQMVKKGQLLASLAPSPAAPEEAARADLVVVEAESRMQAAQAEVERGERLIKERAIAQVKVDDAHRELKVATEAVQAARSAREVFRGAAAGRGAGSYRVLSPIDGVVVEVRATEGKSVSAFDLLFRVVNLQELWVLARVPERKAAQVRADQNAAFRVPGLDEWFPLNVVGDEANAAVANIGHTVDPRSRTVDVIYSLFQADPRLRVGALLRVSVPAGERQTGLLVPLGAVIDDDGQKLAYVQISGESFAERKLRLGAQSGRFVLVESGISEGERVVTRGGNVIRLSSRASNSPAHGHVH
jgi:cobalt-zinc-cadmium efflux system membrane fusion protein